MNTRWKGWATKIAVLVGMIAIVPLWSWRVFAAPRGDILWSAPLNLSNTSQLSTHPAIVTDGYGYVHVFWSEEAGGPIREPGDLGGAGNTIYYTRWDGAIWTPPVDILFVPGDQVAEFVDVDVGPDNRLYIVWTGQENFYYSDALSWEAESAHAWRTPVVIASGSARSRLESSIVADANGDLHIVYATRGDGAGVYYIRSHDAGATWSSPYRLSQPFRLLEISYSNVKMIVDGLGYLHVMWQTNQQEGYGQAVYYTRSVDGGTHWSAPWQFGYRDPGDTFVDWPYLTVRGDSEMHLIYIDGGTRGRLQRISLDNGETWSEPYDILPELEGINGYVIPVVDSAGDMHLIANMRTYGDNVVGIYYARWDGNDWSPAVPLDNSSPAAPSAHYTAATVRLGYEIYVVYTDISVGEIWMLHGLLSYLEPMPADATPHLEAEVAATPTPNDIPIVTVPVSGPSQPELDWHSQPSEQTTEWSAIALGLISSILLVVGVFVGTRVHNRHTTYREKEADFV